MLLPPLLLLPRGVAQDSEGVASEKRVAQDSDGVGSSLGCCVTRPLPPFSLSRCPFKSSLTTLSVAGQT